jgi:tetratricopeptide (TPR) repeat protein
MATYLRYLAEIHVALASLEENHARKVVILREAVKIKERGLVLNAKFAEMVGRGQPHLVKRLVSKNYLEYGDLLSRLYNLTSDETVLSKVATAFSEASKLLKETTSFRALGESYWKAGEAYDHMRANMAAADNFALAAKTYAMLSEKNPQMGTLFLDYARYLEAWSNIENARASQRRLAFDEAEKFYAIAASLHQSAGRWSFLAPYYTGLAKLESAENFSRRGQSSESISVFGEAAGLFRESSVSLHKHAAGLESPEEKAMVERIASSFKDEYCQVRIVIEEARMAEDQGDNRTSADKFRRASQLLEETARKTVSKREKNELLHISNLSKAWQHLVQAKATDQSKEFQEAALQFEKSLDSSPDENAKDLSLGHLYFCKALEASSQFELTLDPALYEAGTKYLTIASNHFANAGFSLQSIHALACKALLDARMHLAKTSKEIDALEKTRSYEEATTLLRQAAEGFKKARQTARQHQVLGLMESVDEQYNVASRLSEISRTLSHISSAVAFPAPVGGGEAPVGHSRFAGSGIEAEYGASTSSNSLPGQEVFVEVRVGNIGSQPIRVIRIEKILPEGAHLVKAPLNARIVREAVIFDHKRTDSMSVETFQFVIRPAKGPVIIRPLVWYADENGRERSQMLPTRVLVGSPMLEHLGREFLDDYESKRLGLDHCGWRTLMSVVDSLKIPRSHVYGEQRWGRRHGRQLEALISSGIVESRVFPGERGRGGNILRVRLAYDQDLAKQYAEQIKGQVREIPLVLAEKPAT